MEMLKPEAGACAARELGAGSQAGLPEHLAILRRNNVRTTRWLTRDTQRCGGESSPYKFPDEKSLLVGGYLQTTAHMQQDFCTLCLSSF